MRKCVSFVLMCLVVISFSSLSAEADPPWYYYVTGPGGSNEVTVDQIGQILYFELDSTTPDYVWGNVRVDFDTNMLECVSIEEVPETEMVEGFWTAWVTQPADPAYGGGGTLYYYDSTGLGSVWAQTWVSMYGQGNTGPSGSYDNTNGIIRFYVMSPAGGYWGAKPLRIGFRIKNAGTAVFNTYANDYTAFYWPPDLNIANEVQPMQSGEGFTWLLENLPYRYASTVNIISPVQEIALDMKPATCSNSLNTMSKGVLPVAVLGSTDFAVEMIDVSTIRLEGVSPLHSAIEDVGTPIETFNNESDLLECTAVGPDGLLDLTLKFDAQELLRAIETNLSRTVVDGETVVLTLTGALKVEYGSTPIQGEDVLVIKKK